MDIADKTFLIDAETRVINIPDGEEHLGVEGDVGTGHKYFKCPRIVGDDRIDLNEHQIYISYVKTNTAKATKFVGDPALYHCNDVALDETGDYITFSWEMSGDVFKTQGLIAFKVMAKKTDGESVKTCWNTRPAIGTVCMTVPDDIEGIAELYPDIITQLLDRMNAVEEIATVEAMQGYVNDYLGRNPVQLDPTLTDSTKAAPADVVGELRSDLVNIFINREYNFTESGTTELFAYAGTTVMIEVSQISGSFNVFTLGHTTHGIFGISNTGVYKFIPQYDGYIRFYTESENASITFKIYLKIDTVFTTDIDARIENMYLYDASPTINDIAIKTRRVDKSIIQNSWGYDLKPGNTIFNLLDAKITSSTQKTTNVIRVRDSAGCLIYNLDVNDKYSIPKETNAICMYVFDRLGNFLRNVRYNELKERDTTNIDDEYFVVLAEYPTVLPNNYWYVKGVEIEWLNMNINKGIYKVGANGDFKTLTSALKSLKDDTSEKTILIESGVYDIFAEMGGADYFNGLPTLQPTEWRNYCNLIPPNTKIIGVGYVSLLFNYALTKNKDVFSCLSSSTGVYLENLNIIQNSGRYGIHLEGGTLSDTIGNVYTMKNVNVKTSGSNASLGIGMNKNTLLNLYNCNVNSDGVAIFHHTNHHDNEQINISNCIVDGTLNLQNWGDGNNGRATVKTSIKNSYVKKLYINSLQSSVTVTDYDVVTFGINNDCDITSQNVTPIIKSY